MKTTILHQSGSCPAQQAGSNARFSNLFRGWGTSPRFPFLRIKPGVKPVFLFSFLFFLFISISETGWVEAVFPQNTWVQKADFPALRTSAVGFSIGAKGYIGTGWAPRQKDFWEWDQATNIWTQKADLGGPGRSGAAGFSIGSKGYIGTGLPDLPGMLRDFWEYDPANNVWTKKADFGGAGRQSAVGFSIGTKGYIGTGIDAGFTTLQDFWEYDPSADTWTQKAPYGGKSTCNAVGFSIGGKGYIGTGLKGVLLTRSRDFWEWDQATNVWTQKADFGGTEREAPAGFSIGNKGYVGSGLDNNGVTNDFWEWNQATNIWTQKANFSAYRYLAVGFSIGNKGYIGTGTGPPLGWTPGDHFKPATWNDFWEYTPDSVNCSLSPVIASDPSPSTTLCVGQSAYITASGGTGYLWNTGSTSAFMVANPTITTTYSVTATDASGCTGTAAVTFIVDPNCASTGISQLDANELKVEIWPNPSSGAINLKASQFEDLKIESIGIYNVFGERIYPAVDFQINRSSPQGVLRTNFQIDLSEQPNGVYFLRIQKGDAVINKEIIIQK
ncbi:MAG: T9SS type A sorting domain-containing protein [Bacteroidetes bacterium]|nr:MAG: T9SS type A sorting domain-containing protein [Bacteroidota bacterium]